MVFGEQELRAECNGNLSQSIGQVFGRVCPPEILDRLEESLLEASRLLGLPAAELREGAPANLVLFDPTGRTEVTRSFLRSQGANNPFLGRTLNGAVRMVLLGEAVPVDR